MMYRIRPHGFPLIRLIMASFLAVAVPPASADVGLISADQQAAIDLAKSRLNSFKNDMEIVKGLPGLDEDIADAIGDGIGSVKHAVDGLDKGVEVIGLVEKLIKLQTTYECLSSATTCMQTEGRTPGCIQAYAFGMSELFSQLHDALDGHEFEAKDFASKLPILIVNIAIKIYAPALKVGSETFKKAVKWGQICKSDEICNSLCEVEENRTLFDCAELQNESPPMPAECETLAMIVNGDKPEPTAENVMVDLQQRQFKNDHSSLTKLETDRGFLGSIVKAASGTSALNRFNATYATVKSRYEAREGLSETGPAEQQLTADSCELQELLGSSYAKSLESKQRFVSAMRTVNDAGPCPKHELIVSRANKIPRRGERYPTEF